MLEELIQEFEELKKIKVNKFSSNNNKYDGVKEKIEAFNNDVFALCDLEPHLYDCCSKDDLEYINQIISALWFFKNNQDGKIDEKFKNTILNDERIIEAIIKLEEKVDSKNNNAIDYGPVASEINKIDYIIDILKDIKPEEYIEESVIELIYDYLKSEIYIKYYDKFIKTWWLINSYNLSVANKRTR